MFSSLVMPAKSGFSTGLVRPTVQGDGRTLLLPRHWGGPDTASLSDPRNSGFDWRLLPTVVVQGCPVRMVID
jgi:hypothetical protein